MQDGDRSQAAASGEGCTATSQTLGRTVSATGSRIANLYRRRGGGSQFQQAPLHDGGEAERGERKRKLLLPLCPASTHNGCKERNRECLARQGMATAAASRRQASRLGAARHIHAPLARLTPQFSMAAIWHRINVRKPTTIP